MVLKHQSLSTLAARHLTKTRDHYDQVGDRLLWQAACYRRWLARYYNLIIPTGAKVLEVGCGGGHLLALLNTQNVTGIDLSEKQLTFARKRVPYGDFYQQPGEKLCLEGRFDFIIVSDTLNMAADIQALLGKLQNVSRPHTRLLFNFPSALWRPIYWFATLIGMRSSHPPYNWLTSGDVRNLLDLADWEPINLTPRLLTPWAPFGLDHLCNRYLAPLIPWFCLVVFGVARTKSGVLPKNSGVSVVIPARNEAGNIENAVKRIPDIGDFTEIVFVEGHSTDETWDEILRVQSVYPQRDIKALRQSGKGKGNAVREGFAVCLGDVLMILDADLTMPPEELPKFFQAIRDNKAEFVNGVRLVYPMEKQAMRFLNLCANKFFSIAFSWLLGQSVKDTLCGTKVLEKSSYLKIAANRSYFGDFDPFGDFDLLFGAAKLKLKIADVPIRYQERIYGTTNIHKWRHGLLLLRMLLFASRKLKFV